MIKTVNYRLKNQELFENFDKLGKSQVHNSYYFLKLKDFENALIQAHKDNFNKVAYNYSVGARILDDLKEYFYITIHL
jgi:hypothetical protein